MGADQGLPTKQWLESEAAEAGSSVQDFVSSLSPALLHVARLEPAAKHTQIELNAWLQVTAQCVYRVLLEQVCKGIENYGRLYVDQEHFDHLKCDTVLRVIKPAM